MPDLPHLILDGSAIDAFSKDYRHGDRVDEHSHDVDQLLYSRSGVMSVTTAEGTWVIPPDRGVWIPADVPHRISMSGRVRMRTLYLRTDLGVVDSDQCRVLAISPLDRELILELVRTPARERDDQWNMLAGVLIERLSSFRVAPLHLPSPRDARARRLARALMGDLESRESFAVLSRGCGASERTLARLFFSETGMTLGQWRQRARILAALELLGEGRSVGAVAHRVGYGSTSAFVTMFRRELGVSPGRYFSRPASRERNRLSS